MFLSARARDFYFALQETLHAASKLDRWQCSQRPSDPTAIVESYLSSSLADPEYSDFDPKALDEPERINHKLWLKVCKCSAKTLKRLDAVDKAPDNEVVFALLQQASSALRTILAADLQSRLDPDVPRLRSRWRS